MINSGIKFVVTTTKAAVAAAVAIKIADYSAKAVDRIWDNSTR